MATNQVGNSVFNKCDDDDDDDFNHNDRMSTNQAGNTICRICGSCIKYI